MSVPRTDAPAKAGKPREMSYWYLLRYLSPIVLKASPVMMTAIFLVGVFHSFSWAASITINRNLYDALAGASSGGAGIGPLVAPLLTYGALMLVQQFLNGLHNYMYEPFYTAVECRLTMRTAYKAARVDPVAFENTSLLDDINKAREGLSGAFMVVVNFLMIFMFYLPYFAYAGFTYFRMKPEIVLALLLVFLPTLLMQIVRSRYYADLEEKSAPPRRRYEYYEKTLCDREYFKETRIWGAFGMLHRMYCDARALVNREAWRTEKRTVAVETGLRVASLAGNFGVLFMLYRFLMQGDISIGSFAAVYGSLGMMFGIMEEIVVRHIGNMAKDLGKVRNFVRFLQLPEREGLVETVNLKQGIALTNASFRYPGQQQDAVHGVSLNIQPGETIAIVGGNGAGKSTLVRLISGLYLPNSGSVKLGGQETCDIAPGALQGRISAVFQKFQRYRMTLEENVSISQIEGGDVADALRKADVSLEQGSFPQGLTTMLSREFDGVDLSGGQWQRVAIARGYHREHDLILLDEPTAAIDPIEESRIYGQFREISRGKTAVIVTHRMGSAKIADRIVVMEQGQILDIGTHEELLARGGLYAQMWEAQAQWYE